jgi:hypothetical protein
VIYILDTDAIVHLSSRPDSNQIYNGLITASYKGTIRTVSQVIDEMKRWPDIHSLFHKHKNTICINNQYHPNVIEIVGHVGDNFEFLFDLTGSKNPDPADPWLIGCAKVHGYTLVTDERPQSVKKIPFVCRQPSINVRCINGERLLAEMGY